MKKNISIAILLLSNIALISYIVISKLAPYDTANLAIELAQKAQTLDDDSTVNIKSISELI